MTLDLGPYLLVVGWLAFPAAFLFFAFRSSGGPGFKWSKLGGFVGYSNGFAGKYTAELQGIWTAIVFTPNIVGTLASIVGQFTSLVGVPQPVVLEIMYYHLSLLLLASIGNGLLKMAERRVLLVFLGEWVSTWAFVSGVLVFFDLLWLLQATLGWFLVFVMLAATGLFAALVLGATVARSVGTYVEASQGWKDVRTS